jgi:hypothetical protein
VKALALTLTAVLLLLAVSVACGEGDGDGESSARGVTSEMIEAMNEYIAVGKAEMGDSPITRDRQVELPEACETPGDLCLFPANTVVSEQDATIAVATNASDASWAFTMRRERGDWVVIAVEYTGG